MIKSFLKSRVGYNGACTVNALANIKWGLIPTVPICSTGPALDSRAMELYLLIYFLLKMSFHHNGSFVNLCSAMSLLFLICISGFKPRLCLTLLVQIYSIWTRKFVAVFFPMHILVTQWGQINFTEIIEFQYF